MPDRKKKAAPKAPKAAPRRARAVRIAKGLTEGKSVSRIASDEGISRQWASHEVHSPAVQQIIAGMVEARRPLLDTMFDEALAVIRAAFKADQLAIEKHRDRIAGTLKHTVRKLGPDHYARLTAARRLAEFLQAGRPMPKPVESETRRGMTLDELEALLREEERLLASHPN